MKILAIKAYDTHSEFELFLNSVSDKLAAAICKKLQAYTQADAIYTSNSLKVLKPKIWGYKGTIYKLRVDNGKESARVLFTKTRDNDLALLHGFIKRTQKTPKKDGKLAIENLQRVEHKDNMILFPVDKYLTPAGA